MENREREIRIYETREGRVPFNEWVEDLRDRKGLTIVRTRLNRLRLSLFGDAKSVGEGVSELRISFGPGYRVYFGLDGDSIVILLLAGDKRTQAADIKTAQEYLFDYRSRDDAQE